jgi:hypothetical protein
MFHELSLRRILKSTPVLPAFRIADCLLAFTHLRNISPLPGPALTPPSLGIKAHETRSDKDSFAPHVNHDVIIPTTRTMILRLRACKQEEVPQQRPVGCRRA